MNIERLEPRRLLAAGDLDATFGNNGIAINERPAAVGFADSAVLPSGKILYSGGEFDVNDALEEERAVLARFNADGTADETFGEDGYVFLDLSPDSTGHSHLDHMIIQDDGKIVAQGATNSQPIIARLNSDGSIDTTFGGGTGRIADDSGDVGARSFDVLPDGKILIADPDGHVTRFLASGLLDTGFGDGGTATFDFPAPDFWTIKAQPDGKILLGGGVSDMTVARLNSDGSLDTGFGASGVVTTKAPDAPNPYHRATHFLVLESGQIIVAGPTSTRFEQPSTGGFEVVRLNANGTLDPTFGNGGGTFISFGQPLPFGNNSPLSRIDIDSAGNIYLIGDQSIQGLAAARVTSDGDIDPEFGRLVSDGAAAVFSIGGGIDPDDKLILNAVANIAIYGPFGLVQNGGFAVTYRVLTSDSAPPAIGLNAGTVSLPADRLHNLLQATQFDDVVYVTRNTFGRMFDSADVQRVSVTGGEGGDIIEMNLHTINADVDGRAGSDKISGGDARDTLRGGADRDFIDGGLSADLITGNGGIDQIRGQGGNDHIYGNGANDYIFGNGGNDRINGGELQDELHGGGGNDVLLAADGAIDHLFGDDGNDSAAADEDDVLTDIETT